MDNIRTTPPLFPKVVNINGEYCTTIRVKHEDNDQWYDVPVYGSHKDTVYELAYKHIYLFRLNDTNLEKGGYKRSKFQGTELARLRNKQIFGKQ